MLKVENEKEKYKAREPHGKEWWATHSSEEMASPLCVLCICVDSVVLLLY